MLEEIWCRHYISVCINYIRLHKFVLILHHGTIADNMKETTNSRNAHHTDGSDVSYIYMTRQRHFEVGH